MEIGNKLNQLRKLSGMTQEQLAEKLNVSRQTISKWETDSTSPDLESIVRVCKIFHVSLDDLLMEGEGMEEEGMEEERTTEKGIQITLNDLMKINIHNRNMTLLLIGGLIFIMVGILNFVYVKALENATMSTQYMLYRYIVTGEYESAPFDYMGLLLPSIIAGGVGFALYNASSPVLLVTSQYYDDGSGNQASIYCDVYYATGKEVKKTGTIESLGTAYPVAYDNTGIYAASGHGMQRFEIDEKTGAVVLAETIYEQFDEEGNASYTLEKVGETEMLTEEEYYEAFKKYSEAAVVNFTYGASGT